MALLFLNGILKPKTIVMKSFALLHTMNKFSLFTTLKLVIFSLYHPTSNFLKTQ